MMSRMLPRVLTGLLIGVATTPALAQISTDGSLGPRQSLAGARVRVAPSLGQQRGGNLYHSFSQFNVNAGQSVTFDTAAGTSRIFSRVTGGQLSRIHGTLAVASDAATDLYLINPAGVVIGPGAVIDVPGRFAASTADSLEFADGAAFDASPRTQATLTSAAPSAFGFLPTNQGVARIQNATLETRTLSVTGSRVEIDNAQITSAGPFMGFAAAVGEKIEFPFVDEPGFLLPRTLLHGELSINNNSQVLLASLAPGGLSLAGGRVRIENASRVGYASFSAVRGSAISVTANELIMRAGASIEAEALASLQGPGIAIGPNVIDLDASFIVSRTFVGTGGPILIQGRVLRMAHDSTIAATNSQFSNSGDLLIRVDDIAVRRSRISTEALPDTIGEAGLIQIRANRLNLRDGAAIVTDSSGQSAAGDLRISARQAVIVRGGSTISSSSGEQGLVGTGAIEIVSPTIVIDESAISSSTIGRGDGASLTLRTTPTGSVTIGGSFAGAPGVPSGVLTLSLLFEGTVVATPGDSSSIQIDVGTLTVERGASISASTATSGDAGTIRIRAARMNVLGTGKGFEGGFFTSVTSQTESDDAGAGRAGDIDIDAGVLRISDVGFISSSTLGPGAAGTISVNAGQLLIDRGAGIASLSGTPDDPASGNAGSVMVRAGSLIRLNDGSEITVSGDKSVAGTVKLDSGGDLLVLNRSAVSAVSGGVGGNAELAANGTIAISESAVTAEAAGSGASAEILLDRAQTVALGNSLINGKAAGTDVLVSITGQNVLLAGSTEILSSRTVIPFSQTDVTFLLSLPIVGLDQSAKLQQDCTVRGTDKSSSFIVEGRGGVAP